MSQALDHLLQMIQHHPGFKELIEHIPEPRIKRYRKGKPAIDAAADMFYASGQQAQHHAWVAFLAGTTEGET